MTSVLVDTRDEYEHVKLILQSHNNLVVDTETDGTDPVINELCGIAIGGYDSDEQYYLPFRHKEGRNLPLELLTDLFETVLTPDRHQTGWNYAFDMRIMRRDGYQWPKKIWEAQSVAHLHDENDMVRDGPKSLEGVAAKYWEPAAADADVALVATIRERHKCTPKQAKRHLHELPAELVAPYACNDIHLTRGTHQYLLAKLAPCELKICEDVEHFALDLARMMDRGCLLDVEMLEANVQLAEVKASELLAEIHEIAGFPVNPRSPKQLKEWLHIPKTDKDALRSLDHPVASKILEYRSWAKVSSTYYQPLLKLRDSNDRAHPSLNGCGTVTSRPSCSKPNLLNIPRGSDIYQVKKAFITRPGYLLAEIDQSQAEIRVIANYTQEPFFLDIIEKGLSLHDVVAEQMNVDRQIAKNINFSANYGIGAKKFAKTYGYSMAKATGYLEDYHSLVPRVRQLYHRCEQQARKHGFIQLWTGRRRHFPKGCQYTYKASANLIQGAVAEMFRVAITRIGREMPELNLILTVYDSILIEAPEDTVYEYARRCRDIIIDFPIFSKPPMAADIKIGRSWGGAEDVQI